MIDADELNIVKQQLLYQNYFREEYSQSCGTRLQIKHLREKVV
jgi:hypothetical protein